MPITNTTPETPVVRRDGRRFYIVKDQDHDQAVVRTVPVGVCAAPPRVNLLTAANGTAEPAPTSPAVVPPTTSDHHGLAGRMQRVRAAVRHPLHPRFGR